MENKETAWREEITNLKSQLADASQDREKLAMEYADLLSKADVCKADYSTAEAEYEACVLEEKVSHPTDFVTGFCSSSELLFLTACGIRSRRTSNFIESTR
jgi:hypothetical protein